VRIESVATLKQQTAELSAELQCYRQPILMTQHGVPSAIWSTSNPLKPCRITWAYWRALRVANAR